MGSRTRAVLGAGLLVLAAVLAWLALGAWRWPDVVRTEDAQLHGPRPGTAWSDVNGQVASLLGAADDVAFRRAVAAFRRGRVTDLADVTTLQALIDSADASLQLARVGRRDPDPRRRSIAANLEAVLVGEAAELETDSGSRIERAAELLRVAIRLDPYNEAAKANLERLVGSPYIASQRDTSRGFGGFGSDAGGTAEASGY